MSEYFLTEGDYDPQDNVEESYWNSLLKEGEFSQVRPTENLTNGTREIGSFASSFSRTHDDWQEAHRILDEDSVLSLSVTGYNRGGLLVEWRSLRGFVPASQLVNYHDAARRDNLAERVGQVLVLRIIEIDAAKNRLILSERAAQVETGARSRLMSRIQIGDTLTGRITNLVEFGAFADLGGVEGLIHISELSWGRVGHPSDILERGQVVQVYVMEVDPDNARVALSIKRLRPDPWATVEQRFKIGQIIEGNITNVVDFGAFACIEEGLEGLIHFSELAEGHFLHPRNVVKEGDRVHARIMTIDGKARRLGLTLRLT
jgi:small subunit ribosomal protein S1